MSHYESKTQDRNQTITYLKALCIIFMVFIHAGSGIPFADRFPYMFHMPLFFFAAGYCFKKKYLDTPVIFLKKRIKGIYWPFVKWGLIFLAFNNIFLYLHFIDTEYYNWQSFINEAFCILFQMRSHPQMLGGYWFLTSLFWGSLISWILLRLFKDIRLAALVTLVLGVCSNYTHWAFPFWNISAREFLAAFLFIVGHWFADKKIKTFCNWQVFASLGIAAIGTYYWRLSVSRHFYNNTIYIPYLITAVLSIWSLYSLFSKWKETDSSLSKTMNYIGNHTIEILTWHFLLFKLVSFVIVKAYSLPIERLSEMPVIIEYSTKGWWVLYVLMGISIPLLFTFAIESFQKSKAK